MSTEKRRTLDELRSRDLEWSRNEIRRLRDAMALALRQGGYKAWRQILTDALNQAPQNAGEKE